MTKCKHKDIAISLLHRIEQCRLQSVRYLICACLQIGPARLMVVLRCIMFVRYFAIRRGLLLFSEAALADGHDL